jgi:hypothetical protein
VACAALVRRRTAVPNEWLAARLAMGHASQVSALVNQTLRDAKDRLVAVPESIHPASIAEIRDVADFARMGRMTLIRAADVAEVGTMDANQRLPAALLRGVPTGHPVRCVMERGVHSRDPQPNCPPDS